MTQKILVTGGAGYIGSHTCKALAAAGFLPVVYDDLSLGTREFVRWGPLVEGDVRDADRLAAVIAGENITGVVHFAAVSAVGESMVDPALYYDINVGGMLALMRTIGRRNDGPVMVFSSTAAVYGETDQRITEDALKAPLNAYGRSKWMCEQIIEDHRRAYGLRAIALRYFNASGADPDGEIGEFRKVETHLIPRALMFLQGHIDDFRVFGSDFPTSDGTAVRDYVHVTDLADAHVLALKRLLQGHAGGAFNVGAGVGVSVAEILAQIDRITGLSIQAPKGGRRPGDPAVLVADPTLARQSLLFEPRLSSLPAIISTAWNWHQKAHPRRRIHQ
jgi:UDP-glucose-4-epimerase GalE